jgi:hypothetical protein
MGSGFQAEPLKRFWIEKLLKVTPAWRITPPWPPHPPESSSWSELASVRL